MPTAQPASKATLADYKTRILRVLAHIQQHLDERLTVKELARVACFSTYHFHRLFSGMMGETLKDHVRRLRLERAALELRVGTKPVVQVALDSGYEAHEAFTRAFKAAYRVAPARFRSNKSPIVALPAPSGVTPSRKLRYDACVTVDEHYAATGTIQVQTIPGGDYAVTTHCGPPASLGETYASLFGRWLPRSGREVRSVPSFLIALNSPQEEKPENQLTDIYLPLQPLARPKRR